MSKSDTGSGKGRVIVGRSSVSGQFSTVKTPGLGSYRVLDRATFDKASKSAGKVLRNSDGRYSSSTTKGPSGR